VDLSCNRLLMMIILLFPFVHCLGYCVCNYCVVYCFECACVILYLLCIVLYCTVLCIVVPLPPGTYPLAVNNNNNKIKLKKLTKSSSLE
jgi:hypothetical protein